MRLIEFSAPPGWLTLVWQGVQDIFDERGPTYATATLYRLWSITEELMVKIKARFELARDPSTEDLESH